jgi:cell division protein FtsZ
MDVADPITSKGSAASQGASIGRPTLKVLGLGGGGSNAVNRMIELGLEGVEFIAANTDKQALVSSLADVKLQIGPRVTRGLGAGGDPRAGAAAAMESSREIAQAIKGADMVFITAGMGGGTGTGAAPVAAEIARELGSVVVAVVTMPFAFEMNRRSQNALEGVKKLQPNAHTLITVPNDRLLQIVPRDLSLEVAFRLADDVLRQGVQGVAELVTRAGLINVDFAHVRELLLHGGGALMAIGMGQGENKAADAIDQALNHPLLKVDSLEQANGILVHFTGGDDLALFEVGDAITELRKRLPEQTDLVMGASSDNDMTGRTQVILIVTGIGGRPLATNTVASFTSQTEQAPRSAGPAPDLADEDLDVPAFIRRRMAVR